MVHPQRNFLRFRHLYRQMPERAAVSLLGYARTLIGVYPEAFWSNESETDGQVVANLENENRTWKLPEIQAPGVVPKAGHRIEESETGTMWEIRSATFQSANHSWHCVCVYMGQHDEIEG